MFIVIEKIRPPLSPRAIIYTAVFARIRRLELPERTGERFWCGFFIFGGRFGRGWFWLGVSRLCGCMAGWPLEGGVAGGTEPLGEEEEGWRFGEEKSRLEHWWSG